MDNNNNNNNRIHKNNLITEFNNCLSHMDQNYHKYNMSRKIHSIHCIIHRYLRFLQRTQITSDRYACDFNWQNMTTQQYMQFYNIRCEYYNREYVQYENTLIYGLIDDSEDDNPQI